MKRLLCWLFGHRPVNAGFIFDGDSGVYPVNVLCICDRCGRWGWDPVHQISGSPVAFMLDRS